MKRRQEQVDERAGIAASAWFGERALAQAQLERIRARQLAQAAFLDQALVDGSHPAPKGRVFRRAAWTRLAVHRAARRDHEVGECDERLRVDGPLRDDE